VGFRALLPDGSTIAPAVEVLSGRLSPRQADRTYKGLTGVCVHCSQQRRRIHEIDNAHLQAALSIADLSVRYVSAAYDRDRMARIMHFAHRPGFLRGDLCQLCAEPNLARHASAVEVIGRWAQVEWPGADVRAELNVVLPGTPPQQFRPDISVRSLDGRPIACIEYQRTPETFSEFIARHSLRCRQFPDVRWYFAPGAYAASGNHRAWLHARGHAFYHCRVDPETGRLIASLGRPPSGRAAPAVAHRLEKCSESSLIRALEERDQPVARKESVELNTSLDMLMLGGQTIRHPGPPNPRAAGPAAVDGPPCRGLPVRVDGEHGWTLPGALPRAGGSNVLVVSPAGKSVLVQRKRIDAGGVSA
jgi:hypothetical protein